MIILLTIFFTCLGLHVVAIFFAVFESSYEKTDSDLYYGIVMWTSLILMVITFISIITIGFYTGNIKEWFGR